MNLYERITQSINDNYYNIGINPFTKATNESAYEFIRAYFKAGLKEKVFYLDFEDQLHTNGKHIHTVILYFLGIILRDMGDKYMMTYLKTIIPNTAEWYNFKYSWFLSCLYHDTASAIENQTLQTGENPHFNDLDYYLGKNDIKYKVYQHQTLNKNANLFTFSENLVKNYFYYRAEHSGSIDHGILGGFLFFDRLVKNYEIKWKRYLSEGNNNDEITKNHDNFIYRDKHWRIEQLDHFAYIADSVISHNIWFSSNTVLYTQYGLDSLIISKNNKINISERPLVYFLDILDVLEPTKKVREKDIIKVLMGIDISYNADNKTILIKVVDCNLDVDEWFESILKLDDYLNLGVILNEREITIKIIQ